MRHRVHGRKLGRKPGHRRAMFRNQLTSLFVHERITTTVEKAKELRPLAERMITLARKGDLQARRRVRRMVQDRAVVQRLFDEIAPRFSDRPGGYTRIVRLGARHGDNAEMAIIELIDYELPTGEAPATGGRKSLMDRAKGMFGGGAAAGAAGQAEADDSDDAEVAEAGETEATDAEEPAATDEDDEQK